MAASEDELRDLIHKTETLIDSKTRKADWLREVSRTEVTARLVEVQRLERQYELKKTELMQLQDQRKDLVRDIPKLLIDRKLFLRELNLLQEDAEQATVRLTNDAQALEQRLAGIRDTREQNMSQRDHYAAENAALNKQWATALALTLEPAGSGQYLTATFTDINKTCRIYPGRDTVRIEGPLPDNVRLGIASAFRENGCLASLFWSLRTELHRKELVHS